MADRNSMEIKQNSQIGKLTTIINTLTKLCVEDLELIKEFEASTKKQRELKISKDNLLEKIRAIQNDKENVIRDAVSLEKQLDNLNDYVEDMENNIINFYTILGFSLSEFKDNIITLTFNENEKCFVRLKHCKDTFELLEMQPEHPLKYTIRDYLKTSQDIRNFLEMLQKFFSVAGVTTVCNSNEKPVTDQQTANAVTAAFTTKPAFNW